VAHILALKRCSIGDAGGSAKVQVELFPPKSMVRYHVAHGAPALGDAIAALLEARAHA
jgi:hypothetical protein